MKFFRRNKAILHIKAQHHYSKEASEVSIPKRNQNLRSTQVQSQDIFRVEKGIPSVQTQNKIRRNNIKSIKNDTQFNLMLRNSSLPDNETEEETY